MFDEETAKAPCSFDFFLVRDNGIRVQAEYQFYNISVRSSHVFERTDDCFNFNQTSKNTFSEYQRKNNSNKLFLATAANWGNAKTAPAYQWLANVIDVHSSEFSMWSTTLRAFEQGEQGGLKQFTLSCFGRQISTLTIYKWTSPL